MSGNDGQLLRVFREYMLAQRKLNDEFLNKLETLSNESHMPISSESFEGSMESDGETLEFKGSRVSHFKETINTDIDICENNLQEKKEKLGLRGVIRRV